MANAVKGSPSEDEVRGQLGRILESPLFAGARRLSQFLEFVVTTSIDGGEIKEALIGLQVYGRDPSYNPKIDSIVRAEASRLRAKLREYYEGSGHDDPIRIELPKGSYRPAFFRNTAIDSNTAIYTAAPHPAGRRRWFVAGMLLVAAAAATVVWRVPLARRPHSIAIAPVMGVGPDRSVDTLADSLAEEMTQVLMASNRWRVAGRSPGENPIGKDQMPTAWGRHLGAEVVLTGSLRAEENSMLTVTLDLVNVADGSLLWTGAYHRQMAYFTAAQQEFARDVVDEFTNKFTGRPLSPASRDYFQARESWSAYTGQGLERSIPLFQQAIRADPKFAPAWAGLADAELRLARMAGGQPEKLEGARNAAIKAIALDDANAEAHEVLGMVLFDLWDFPGAASELRRALVADPVRVPASIAYSRALVFTGQMVTAEEVIATARARLPTSADLLFQEASILFAGRRFDKMESLARQLIVLAPDKPWGYWLVGLSLVQRGEVPQAIAEFRGGLQQSARDDLRILCALGHAYGLIGDRERAVETMRRYLAPNQKQTPSVSMSCCAAMTYAALNERDRAFEWLEKARAGRDPSFPYFPLDFRFDSLRGDPRYTRLAVGLSMPGIGMREPAEPLAR